MKFRAQLLFVAFCLYGISSNTAFSQPSRFFENGELVMQNSEVRKGMLWLVSDVNGSLSVLLRNNEFYTPRSYKASEIVSAEFMKTKRLYISKSVMTPQGNQTIFAKVHFKGNYSLISYEKPAITRYFIIDMSGNSIEMINLKNLPDKSTAPITVYCDEYQDALYSLFKNENYLHPLIASSEFSVKDISNILAQYHRKNKMHFELFPPPPYQLFFGGTFSGLILNQKSNLNPNLISKSPLAGFSTFGGIKLFDQYIAISLDAGLSYGIIFHDEQIKESNIITTFYEDRTRMCVFHSGLSIGVRLFKSRRIIPELSIGVNYNSFLTYSREATEESFNSYTNTVSTQIYDDYQNPSGFIGRFFKAGIIYNYNEKISIKMNYSFIKYFDNSTNWQNGQSTSFSFIRKIN